MIKYISLDLQGTLSDSKFSDNFWLEIIPQKYSEKYKITIEDANKILKQKFKEYGVYNLLYYDDKYWSEYLNFNTKQELDKSKIRPSINKEVYKYFNKIDLPKIIISTTTDLFINYELGEKIKEFEKIYSCVNSFGIGGKTDEVYQKVARELKVNPKEILHIGDNSLMDVENAKRAGVNAVLYDGNIQNLIYNTEIILNNL